MATSSEQTTLDRWIVYRDSDAFKAIADRYAGMVYATCCRVLGDAAEAEDVAQECFEALVRAQEPPRDYLGPWLHRVATNLSIKRIRATGRRLAREAAYAKSQPQTTATDWDDIYRLVDEALLELPDDLRVPLIAHYLDGASHAAIAARLNIPRRTISSRITRGLELLGQALRKQGVTATASVLATLMGANMSQATAAPTTLTQALGRLALSLSATRPVGAGKGAQFLKGANVMKIAAIAVACLVAVTVLTVFLMATPSDPDNTADSVKPPSVVTIEGEDTTTSTALAQAIAEFSSHVDSAKRSDSATHDAGSADLLSYILDQQDRHIEAIESYSYEAEYSLNSKIRFDEAELREIESGKSSPVLGGFDHRGWWRFTDEGTMHVVWQPGGQFEECSSVPMNHIVRSITNPEYTARIFVVLDSRLPAMEHGLGNVTYKDPPPSLRFKPSVVAYNFDPIMSMYGIGNQSLRKILNRKELNFVNKVAWKENDKFHILLENDKQNVWQFEIDPLKGFSIVHFAFTSDRNDPKTDTKLEKKLVPQEIEPDLWFPLSVEQDKTRGVLSATNEHYVESKWKLRVTKVTLNGEYLTEQFLAAALGPEAQGREFIVETVDGKEVREILVGNEFVEKESLTTPVRDASASQPSKYDEVELAGIVAEKSKGDTRIAKTLLKPISLEFGDTSLDGALEFISSYVKVEFRVDNNVPVTTNIEQVSVRKKSLHEALTTMLEPLGLDYEYEPSRGYLLIRPAASS